MQQPELDSILKDPKARAADKIEALKQAYPLDEYCCPRCNGAMQYRLNVARDHVGAPMFVARVYCENVTCGYISEIHNIIVGSRGDSYAMLWEAAPALMGYVVEAWKDRRTLEIAYACSDHKFDALCENIRNGHTTFNDEETRTWKMIGSSD